MLARSGYDFKIVKNDIDVNLFPIIVPNINLYVLITAASFTSSLLYELQKKNKCVVIFQKKISFIAGVEIRIARTCLLICLSHQIHRVFSHTEFKIRRKWLENRLRAPELKLEAKGKQHN